MPMKNKKKLRYGNTANWASWIRTNELWSQIPRPYRLAIAHQPRCTIKTGAVVIFLAKQVCDFSALTDYSFPEGKFCFQIFNNSWHIHQ